MNRRQPGSSHKSNPMKKGKIAIVGGDSFLARHLRNQINDEGPTVYTRGGINPFDYPRAIPDMESLANHGAIILTAAGGVQAKKDGGRVDIFGINTFFPIQLVQEMEVRNFKGTLITFGSYFEIGDCPNDRSFTETQLVHSDYATLNPYVVSKRLLSRFWNSYSGPLRWFHLILPSLYGKGENPARIISYLIASLREGIKLRVSEGTQVRQYLHVSDAISFIRLSLSTNISPGMYNLAPDHAITIADLRSKVMEMVGDRRDVKMETIPSRDEGQKFLKLDGGKARATGWSPAVSLEEGIKSYWN
jgi:nucleoside-diphosphate-sugar epimerase